MASAREMYTLGPNFPHPIIYHQVYTPEHSHIDGHTNIEINRVYCVHRLEANYRIIHRDWI